MEHIEKIFGHIDHAGLWISRIFNVVIAALIGYAGFKVLAVFGYSGMAQFSGAILITMIAIPIVWLALKILSFFNA